MAEKKIGDVVLDEGPGLVPGEMRDVGGFAGDEIVHPHHVVPARDQRVREVGTEEAGRPGYEEAHARRRPMLSYVKPRPADPITLLESPLLNAFVVSPSF